MAFFFSFRKEGDLFGYLGRVEVGVGEMRNSVMGREGDCMRLGDSNSYYYFGEIIVLGFFFVFYFICGVV